MHVEWALLYLLFWYGWILILKLKHKRELNFYKPGKSQVNVGENSLQNVKCDNN